MIDREQIRHVARLARLKLTQAEEEQLTGQMGAIIRYVEQLNEVDTAGVEATKLAAPGHKPLREDRAVPSLTQEEILKNAPKAKKGFFAVPKVIG
ncbi:MAG: Asp-tRNA(Asn)/Glu-tRNA(Gln) amidotransferase subunit GatC [Chitinivibrionales bacterium]|nr:Asp-tRNA(Asn)/Glu-tRNA(Gln) amidotransferase subunit GatC [Chitinivibrionales bacterium]